MTVLCCHHHGVTVASIERSLPFYRDLLGLELLRVSQRRDLPAYDAILGFPGVEIRVALLRHRVHEFLLELVQYVAPPGRTRDQANTWVGAAHLAFQVDHVDALHARLRAAGFGAIHAPVDVERDGVVVARACYALDPDGISVELFEEYHDVKETS